MRSRHKRNGLGGAGTTTVREPEDLVLVPADSSVEVQLQLPPPPLRSVEPPDDIWNPSSNQLINVVIESDLRTGPNPTIL